jgi:L-ribulose-5-phosphate 3-epimerase
VKMGINRWCLPPTMTSPEVFTLASKVGFEGIELNLEEVEPGAQRPEALARIGLDAPDAAILDLRRQAEQAGLDLPSLSSGLFWRYPPTSDDAGVREKALAIGERALQVAKLLGANTVLVVPGAVTADVSYRDAYDRARGFLRELAPSAERAGVSIGVENVWNKFLLSPLEFARFLDEVASPAVGAYLDLGNVLIFGFPHHWVETLGPRIRKVHVKDFRSDIGNRFGFAHLLHGDLDWPRAMAALRSIGYDDYVTTELSVGKFLVEKTVADTASSLELILQM